MTCQPKSMPNAMRPLLLAFVVLAAGCSYFQGNASSDPVLSTLDDKDHDDKAAGKPQADKKAPAKGVGPKFSPYQVLELKQAKTWARLEQMERELLNQRETLKLLEKGLLLGIAPDELKAKKSGHAAPSPSLMNPTPTLPAGVKVHSDHATLARSNVDTASQQLAAPPPLDVGDSAPRVAKHYDERMKHARELFQQGRYSNAYLEFSKIERDFEAGTRKGEPQFWIGRCWLQMKEYQNAKQYFAGFVAEQPSSPWLANAKLYLAQTEMALGLRENAVAMLQGLIREHPYEGSAEAAKHMLRSIRESL